MTFIGENNGRKSYLPELKNYESDDIFAEESEDEEDRGTGEDIQAWDYFKHYPPKLKTGSNANTGFMDSCLKIIKLIIYGILFILVLGGGIIARGTIIFATSQINDDGPTPYCDYNDAEQRPGGKNLSVITSEESRLVWYWCIFLAFIVPELLGLLSAMKFCLFKKQDIPKIPDLMFMMMMDGINAVGEAMLFLCVIPELNSIQALVATSCVSILPGLLGIFSKNGASDTTEKTIFSFTGDILAFVGQLLGAFMWLYILWPDGNENTNSTSRWLLPIALLLTSCRWWSNYVSQYSSYGFIQRLANIKERLQTSKGITMGCTTVYRIIIFFLTFLIIASCKGIELTLLFGAATFRGQHNISFIDSSSVNEVITEIGESSTVITNSIGYRTVQTHYVPLIFFIVHVVSAFITYLSGKFACRTLMQTFGFSVPSILVLPGSIAIIIISCAFRYRNSCVFHGFLPDYMFFDTPVDIDKLSDFLNHWYLWIGLLTLSSQAWITRHIWSPNCEKLATKERLFAVSTYDTLIVDQSIMLNRRVDENIPQNDPAAENLNVKEETDDRSFGVEKSDRVTRILACATMWHETKDEMGEFVESILRLDVAQRSKHFSQGQYNVELRDYYELETHIFFDDAFRCMHGCEGTCKHDENETQVNDYVMTLIDTMKNSVERRNTRADPPMKYPAPYGGRLEWRLPGKTSMVVHLKDKNKIRHRKRWSQVMYMYYLLGYRLMDRKITWLRKMTIAENTYLLTLDGDIDFRPSAVKVLIDLMKRDKLLGAACGRIHPVGTGPMVWFQKFEYAIGHWLQKSTEHTIGSVLCSPGCFSLFRARAIMDHNVMRKYAIQATEPRHYIQYDQGEDRWLCTLILQRGFRVEYSAASDSYTHAPETFNEFYNQRRRWIPSTIANIFDLLNSANETRKINDNISWLYIVYQWILMGSTVLGPGTIFLMLVGAFVAAFRIDNWTSFGYNLIPIAIFVVVCSMYNADIQVSVARVISAFYGLVMIAVLVAIMIQITEDGWVAPSTILFFVVASQLVIAGLLHPQEWSCLLCGLVYYVTVPSMYMLLIIYSLFNVNNVTWGTRDSKTPAAETEEENESAAQTKNDKKSVAIDKANISKAKKGSIEFSLAGLFKCMLCTQDVTTDEDRKFGILAESLDRISSRLDAMDNNADVNDATKNHRSEKHVNIVNEFDDIESAGVSVTRSDSERYLDDSDGSDEEDIERVSVIESDNYGNGASRELGNFLVSPYWLQDERLRKGGVEFLTHDEETFWEGLIEKYLHPIDEDKKQIAKTTEGLKNLRDENIFKFFMVNALFVLIVFLMQLHKDVLYLEWPLGETYNITFEHDHKEVHVTKQYLKLEPIGCLFIIGFVLILGVQFIAMLFHRCNTFAHVLANTNIDWSCCKPAVETPQTELEKEAEELADHLERVIEENVAPPLSRRFSTNTPKNRHIVLELADSTDKQTKKPSSVDAIFRKSLKNTRSDTLSRVMSSRASRRVVEALDKRNSTLADLRKSQIRQYETDNPYHNPESILRRAQPRPVSGNAENGWSYDNGAFVSDDTNDDLPKNNVTTMPHRPSHVKFNH